MLLAALNCESVQPETKSLPWLEFEWPEADRLFQKNDYWIGGDGAYSVDLGSGRILWMFGDSWIDTTGLGRRENAVMVSNTLALQEGYDPVSAKIQFFWHNRSGVAKAFSGLQWRAILARTRRSGWKQIAFVSDGRLQQ